MKKLLIALASASAVLGAGAASAQPYYHNWDHRDRDWHDRGWHDRDWRDHDRGRHYGWYGHPRAYYGYPYASGSRVCAWRYGERVCWYQY